MKKLLLVVVIAALPVSLFLLPAADASEPKPEPPVDAWLFEAKIVMVRTATADVALQPPTWARGEDGLPEVDTPWNQVLGQLRARGMPRLLLDGMTTTLSNVPTEIDLNQAMLVDTYERRDKQNEYRKASTINEGVSVKLLPMQPHPLTAAVQYELVVNWALPTEAQIDMPLQRRWRVKGTWGPLRPGKTLVLSHREQIRGEKAASIGLEIYAFLTPTKLSR